MDYFDLAEEHGGLLADAFAGTQGAVLRGQLRHRLALPDRRIARDRPRAQRGRRAGQLRRAVARRTATTASCSTSRRSTAWCRVPHRMSALPQRYELADDPARIDAAAHAYLTRSYWSPGIPLDQVERQNAGSHCLGAYP